MRHVRFQERITQTPSKERTDIWRVSRDYVIRDASCNIAYGVLTDEIARVDRKHLYRYTQVNY